MKKWLGWLRLIGALATGIGLPLLSLLWFDDVWEAVLSVCGVLVYGLVFWGSLYLLAWAGHDLFFKIKDDARWRAWFNFSVYYTRRQGFDFSKPPPKTSKEALRMAMRNEYPNDTEERDHE